MAQFLDIAGTQLTLPESARLDLAFTVTPYYAAVGTGANLWTSSTNYYDVVTGLSFSHTTGSTTAARLPTYRLADGNGRVIGFTCCPQSQAASTTGYYNFATSYGAAFSNTDQASNNFYSAPLPVFVMTGGAFSYVDLLNNQAGDSALLSVILTVLRVPTGPGEGTGPEAQSVPTPILV